MKKTDYRFKILYAIGMIMVVCTHTKGGGGIALLSDWFPFGGIELPLFMFCSGYFYKSKSEKAVKDYIIKKIKTLIIPLYIYNLIYGLVVLLSRYKGFTIGGNFTAYNLLIMPIISGHQFTYNLGGWFVIPLFMIEVFNVLNRVVIKKFIPKVSEYYFFILSIALGIIGNILSTNGYVTGWWLVLFRFLYFIPFYEFGIVFKEKFERFDKKVPTFYYFSAIFIIKLVLIIIYDSPLSYPPVWGNSFKEGVIIPIIVGYLGILFFMRLSTILEPVIGKSKWINLIADNTYSIMINQFLGFMLVKGIYATLCKYHIACLDFDFTKFKTDIWYYYVPGKLGQPLIIYAVAGIVIPILIQKLIDKGKIIIKNKHILS